MPIAKETLRIGFTIAATEGTYVSQSAVDRFGWSDKVEKGPDIEVSGEDVRDDVAPSTDPADSKKARAK